MSISAIEPHFGYTQHPKYLACWVHSLFKLIGAATQNKLLEA